VELFMRQVHQSGRHQVEDVRGSTNPYSLGTALMGEPPAQLKRSQDPCGSRSPDPGQTLKFGGARGRERSEMSSSITEEVVSDKVRGTGGAPGPDDEGEQLAQ
jgi:hypothetical protein